MTLSRWHEDLAAHDEAFACLQDLLDPSSFATTVVKAFREWGQGLLRLATALVRENAALERENATLRDWSCPGFEVGTSTGCPRVADMSGE